MIVNRQDIKEPLYREILDKETHHEHVIIKDKHGTIRWKANSDIEHYLKNISLNDLCPLLHYMGYDKNSEVYRKLYRDIGYSLSGYHEIFYWDMNNDDTTDYIPNKGQLPIQQNNQIE